MHSTLYLCFWDDEVHAQVSITTAWFSPMTDERNTRNVWAEQAHKAPLALAYEWTTMNNVNSAGWDPTNTDWLKGFKQLLQSVRERGRRWEVRARERVNVLLMNWTRRQVRSQKQLSWYFLEGAWNAIWECFANGSVPEYSMNFSSCLCDFWCQSAAPPFPANVACCMQFLSSSLLQIKMSSSWTC